MIERGMEGVQEEGKYKKERELWTLRKEVKEGANKRVKVSNILLIESI